MRTQFIIGLVLEEREVAVHLGVSRRAWWLFDHSLHLRPRHKKPPLTICERGLLH